MTKEFTCIVCPNGCSLVATESGDEITVSGNTCPKGEAYAKAELTAPVRSLTSTVKTVFSDRPVLPVRTSGEIPKEKIFTAMQSINKIVVKKRMKCGETVKKDFIISGVDLVATDDIE